MNETIYMNRELSWLKFNERVLEEAENPKVPLCERLTFASISATMNSEYKNYSYINKNGAAPIWNRTVYVFVK